MQKVEIFESNNKYDLQNDINNFIKSKGITVKNVSISNYETSISIKGQTSGWQQ